MLLKANCEKSIIYISQIKVKGFVHKPNHFFYTEITPDYVTDQPSSKGQKTRSILYI